jgi:serine/threonine protein kinase
MLGSQELFELSPVSPKNSKQIGEYSLLRTIENSKCKIKLALHRQKFNYCVLKMYDKSKFSTPRQFSNEKSIYSQLDHANCVKLIEILEDCSYSKNDKKTYQFHALVLEYAAFRDLFYHIHVKGGFEEAITRSFFLQILSGVNHLHERGFAHMDLKPENIFINNDYILKLADFELAQPISSLTQKVELQGGTQYYMPPEVFLKSEVKSAEKFDIFSLGVILFVMLCGHFPFKTSQAMDPFYKLIRKKKYERFWGYHEKKGLKVDVELKQLIMSMLDCDWEKRPTVKMIMEHPWCKKAGASYEKVKEEIEERWGLQHKKKPSFP